jgi:hypothetical protein
MMRRLSAPLIISLLTNIAFGIKLNGMAVDQAQLPNRLKKYKSVKTVDQYNNMVRCLSHWGEDEYLAAGPEDDMEALRIYRFHRQHLQGYNYVKYFSIEESESLDGSPMKILIHKNTGGIVVHVLFMSSSKNISIKK